MKSNKEYRFETNEMEKIFHDKFKGKFENDNTTLSAIIFGWEDKYQKYPNKYLTETEEDICLTLIQWLGSPVGQGFLDDCGYEQIKK